MQNARSKNKPICLLHFGFCILTFAFCISSGLAAAQGLTPRPPGPYVIDIRGATSGIPQGPSSSIVERFTPTPDGTRLGYTMTITDPATFTAPVELKRSWVWRPDETVKPYDCVERKNR